MDLKINDELKGVEIKRGDIILRNKTVYIVMQELTSDKLMLRDLNGFNCYGGTFTDISEVLKDRQYTHFPQSEYQLELVRKEK